MKYLLILVVLAFNCCNCTKEMTKSKDEAIKVSNLLLKGEGLDIQSLNIEVTEQEDEFLISYTPKDTMSLGNSAEIVINKKSCDVISKKLYQ